MQGLQVPYRLFAGLNQLLESTEMFLVSRGFWGPFIHVLNEHPIRRNYALLFLKLGPRAALYAPLSSGSPEHVYPSTAIFRH